MYAAGMGQGQTLNLLLSVGANPFLYSRPDPSCRSRRTFLHYAIARGHLDLVLDALGTIRKLYGTEALQVLSQLATLITIFNRRRFTKSGATFFSKLIKNLADVNMTVNDGHKGVQGNNLMHYVLSVEEALALVRCGFDQFNSPNSDGKFPINSLAHHSDPALVKFCIENGTSVGNKDQEGRTILFDLFSNLQRSVGGRNTRETLASIRLCLDAGVDIFETDSCICACSPGGCTISSVFSVEFSSALLEFRPGLLWTLEWVTLVEEHCGVEDARRVLLLLLRRAMCNQYEIDITHTCCHRGRGIASREQYLYKDRPPLAHENITDIQNEESEFIDALEDEIEKLASKSLHCLWSKWMSVIKAKHDAHVKAVNKERAEAKVQLPRVRVFSTIQIQTTREG